MKHYSVLEVTPTTDAWIPAYIEPTTNLVKKHHGRYLARTASHETKEGDREAPGLRVIIEWDSKEDAEAFLADPEYKEHFDARTEGSISHHALIEAKDDLLD
ncbi:DUF1330 domain-containing protein [Rubritalea marina]|uniref:DUF1330 domain-containing protein n=1 Tax=Rubritalea marina TaxID=361055 RepID=UPI0003824542|nr:DUF1330 domain-containing protein [Rubritalea marina]